MAEITIGIRAILSHPLIYSLFTLLIGAHGFRKNFIATLVRPFQGMKILDIECGRADVLSYLSNVEYWGFSISEEYIQHARVKFGNRGSFQCKQFELPAFDTVLAIGVLHHLDDSSAVFIMRLASNALKTGGRLLIINLCLEPPSQSQIARFLNRRDRGQNVRDKAG